MDVKLPDGRIIKGVPNGITRTELMRRIGLMKEGTQSLSQQQPKENGFVSGVKSDIQDFSSGVQDIAQNPSKNLFANIGRYASESTGLLGDVAGRGLSAITPDFIEDPVKKAVGQGVEYIAGTKPVQAITQGVQSLPQDIQDIAGGALSLTGASKGSKVGAKATAKPLVKIEELVNVKKLYPDADKIKNAAQQMYTKAEASGGSFSPNVLDEIIEIGEVNKPKGLIASEVVGLDQADDFTNKLAEFKGKDIDLADFETLDKALGQFANKNVNIDGSVDEVGKKFLELQAQMRNSIIDPKNIKGDKKGIDAYKKATKLWSIQSKMRDIDLILSKAEGAASASGESTRIKTGLNNLYNSKKIKGYTKREKDLINKARKTGKVEELLKNLGSRLNFIGGGLVGGPAGAATGAAVAGVSGDVATGLAAKRARDVQKALAERSGLVSTSRRTDPLINLIRRD